MQGSAAPGVRTGGQGAAKPLTACSQSTALQERLQRQATRISTPAQPFPCSSQPHPHLGLRVEQELGRCAGRTHLHSARPEPRKMEPCEPQQGRPPLARQRAALVHCLSSAHRSQAVSTSAQSACPPAVALGCCLCDRHPALHHVTPPALHSRSPPRTTMPSVRTEMSRLSVSQRMYSKTRATPLRPGDGSSCEKESCSRGTPRSRCSQPKAPLRGAVPGGQLSGSWGWSTDDSCPPAGAERRTEGVLGTTGDPAGQQAGRQAQA